MNVIIIVQPGSATLTQYVVAVPGMLPYLFWLPNDVPDRRDRVMARAVEHVAYCMEHHKLPADAVFPLVVHFDEKKREG